MIVGAEPVDGTFPLVVFAHGWNGRSDTFLDAGSVWAEAGYVVALPTFPLSREGVAFGDDYLQQPGDISAVIDSMGEGGPDGELEGLTDLDHVAVGGHSLGSATVFRLAYSGCCLDDRVDATIPVSGGPADIGQGGYLTWPPDADAPRPRRRRPRRAHRHRRWRVRPRPGTDPLPADGRGGHVSVFGANGALFADAVLAFLDAQAALPARCAGRPRRGGGRLPPAELRSG